MLRLRQETGLPQAWDIPSSAIHYTKVLSTSKYGDIFAGQLDGKGVAIKTLKPDSSVGARDAFDRELESLRCV